MSLSSMTGFARNSGRFAAMDFVWEVKSVNAKGLDIRLKVPTLYEGYAEEIRARTARTIQRGTCFIQLVVTREAPVSTVRINTPALDALLVALKDYDGSTGVRAPSLGSLLAIRGIVEVVENVASGELAAPEIEAVLTGFDTTLASLVAARQREGDELLRVLTERIDTIERLAQAADAHPARTPAAIRTKLAADLARLFDAAPALDPQRLHQEAMLLATRADIREEIDRLYAHVCAARELLAADGPVGRRLDFLAQEFSREANTLCSKSNDIGLTAIGLDLKTEVEQFREQVQNVE